MKIKLIVLLVLLSHILMAQNWPILRIKNGKNQTPVSFAKANLKPPIFADDNGFLILPKNTLNQINISAWNFADTTIFLNQLPQKDTVTIYLRPQPEELNEVLVNPKNSWLQSRIYAFERWEKGWVFLMNKQLVVTDNQLDILYQSPQQKMEGKWPHVLFADVSEHLFLLGSDSVRQFYVTDSAVYFYPLRAKSVFDAQIKPLLAHTTMGYIYRETQETTFDFPYTERKSGSYFEFNAKHPPLHNCGAIVKLKTNHSALSIYKSLDTSAYQAAQNAFSTYIGYHIKYWSVHEDSGYFSPRIKELRGRALHSYRGLFAHFRQNYFLENQNLFYLFDPYSKQLITFNQELNVVKTDPFNFMDCPREEFLYTDKATGKWWLQRRKRGLDVLESVKPGDPAEQFTLDPFVSNIRVYNNVVFYLNQYDELRIKRME